MAPAPQNLTVQLDRVTIERAKLLAALRSTSVSKLVASVIDGLVRDDDQYRQAELLAKKLLKRGFHLGRTRRFDRASLHER